MTGGLERLSPGLHFVIAVAAIYRAVFTGLEGDLGILAALGAYYREHLARRSGAIAFTAHAPGSADLAAAGAAFGLVLVTLGLEELLLLRTEGEGRAAVGALEFLVTEAHG